MKTFYRTLLIALSFILLWQAIKFSFQLPSYILPSPLEVFNSWHRHFYLILQQCFPTLIEVLLGLSIGTIIACLTAILMCLIPILKHWIQPLILVSQAIPTFAIAPLFVLWFGFGLTSKVFITILMLFFPITSAFYDGLMRTNTAWLDLAKTLHAKPIPTFLYIRIPAALPSLASGLRIATAIAPIGAIVGEWVGASRGLGYLMLNANARMQIDLMFAVLFTIIIFSLTLYFAMDKLLTVLIPWQIEN
jgi:putative hydroxymethylpyrimidine transport system permease protein